MASVSFMDLLHARWRAGFTMSIGLDAGPTRLPEEFRNAKEPLTGVVDFHRAVIMATRHLAGAYKPQIAGFEAMGAGGFETLTATIAAVRELAPDVPVILDAKRGDIGNTNERYVEAVFDVLGADAVTVAPYMGPETMAPFLERTDRGVIVLCRTSNPGSGRYQNLEVDGVPLYQYVARDVAETWNTHGNCGLVIGATYPGELEAVRSIVGDMPILVPGIGAQGGDLEATVKAGMTADGGLLLHASRSILYAWEAHEGNPAAAITAAAEQMHAAVGAARA